MSYTHAQIREYARRLGDAGASADEIETFVANAKRDADSADASSQLSRPVQGDRNQTTMHRYQVTAPDGRTVILEGASAPTDADLEEIFRGLPAPAPAMKPPQETPYDLMRERGGFSPGGSAINKRAQIAAGDALMQVGLPIAGMAGGPLLSALLGSAGNSAVQIRKELMGEQDGFKPGEAIAAPAFAAASPLRGAGFLKAAANAGINTAGAYGAEELRHKLDDPKGSPDNAAQTAGIVGAVSALSPMVGRIIGRLTGNVAPEELARLATLKADNAPSDRVLKAIQNRGGAAVPSSVNPGVINRTLESVAGIQNVEGAVARNNRPVYNAIAREEASLPANTPIDYSSLESARKAIGDKSYALAEANGFGDKLNNWRDASTKLKAADENISGGNFTNARGDAVDKAQKAFDDATKELDAAAAKAGLTADFDAAKQAFAKNYDVQRATPAGTGSISPGRVAAMEMTREPGGMTGGLRDIAEFHNAFGRSAKEARKVATAPGAASSGYAGLMLSADEPAAKMVGILSPLRGPLAEKLASPEYQAGKGVLGRLSGGAVRDYMPATSADPWMAPILNRLAAIQAARRARSDASAVTP